MSAKITIDSKAHKVFAEISKQKFKISRGIMQAWHEIGSDLNRETKKLIMTPKHGIWHANLPNRSSAPLEAPATQSGRLAGSQAYKVRGFSQLEFGETAKSDEGAPYPAYLEWGTFFKDGAPKMLPRPHLSKAAENTSRNAIVALERYVKREIGA